MSVTIAIGAQSLTHGDLPSITILDVFAPAGDVCEIEFLFNPNDPTTNYHPQVMEELRITWDDDTRVAAGDAPIYIFTGPITEIESTPLGHNTRLLKVRAQDQTFKLDTKLVAGFYNQSTAEAMVKQILIDYFPTTFGLAAFWDMPESISILPKSFDWKKVSECVQEIAEEKRYVWWVDFDGIVHFKPATRVDLRAPVSNITPATSTDIGDFRFTVSGGELKNSLFVKDFFFRNPNVYYQPGNSAFPSSGSGKFPAISASVAPSVKLDYLPYEISSMTFEVSEDSGVTWDSTIKDYAVRYDLLEKTPGVGTDPIAGSAYVDMASGSVTLYYRTGVNNSFPANCVYRTSYRPIVAPALPEVHKNVHSIASLGNLESGIIAGDGEHQYMVGMSSLEFGGDNPINTLSSYISALMEQYAWPVVSGSFVVYWDGERNIGSFGWAAGQSFTLQEDSWNLFDWEEYLKNGVKSPLTCWIKSVRTTIVNPQAIKYEINFSSVLGGL